MGKEKAISIAMITLDTLLALFIIASAVFCRDANYVNDTDVVLLSLVDAKKEDSTYKLGNNERAAYDAASSNIIPDEEIVNEEIPAGIILSFADKNVSDVNLSNYEIWRPGSYDKLTGIYSVSLDAETKICSKDVLLAKPNTEYSVQISNSEYRMTALELDSDKKVILASDLADGITFKTTENTKYFAITLYYYNEDNTHQIDIWKKIFNEGFFIKISENVTESVIKSSESEELKEDKKEANSKEIKKEIKKEVEIETISIPSTLSLYEYESSVLIPKFTPVEITDAEVSYVSSNPVVANVTETGTVKAYTAGKTKITAKTANGKISTCIVTVKEANMDPLDFTDQSLWMEGYYSCNDGKYEKFEGRICLKDYIKCSSSERYIVNLTSSDYIMLIREIDSDKNFIKTTALSNEESFITTDKTRYLGISLYSPGNSKETYNKYMQMLENGMKVGLIDAEKVNVKTYTLELNQTRFLELELGLGPGVALKGKRYFA